MPDSQTSFIRRFARVKGFMFAGAAVGCALFFFMINKTDSIDERVKVVETRIINPCALTPKEDKENSVSILKINNAEKCRMGLIRLLEQTSDDPQKAIDALGLKAKSGDTK